MKKCLNCKSDTRDSDKYCRNCGVKVSGNAVYIVCSIMNFIIIVAIIFLIMLFVASYFV